MRVNRYQAANRQSTITKRKADDCCGVDAPFQKNLLAISRPSRGRLPTVFGPGLPAEDLPDLLPAVSAPFTALPHQPTLAGTKTCPAD